MKKIFISLVLTVCAFAVSASAQTSTQKKMLPFAVGMSVSVLGEMYDENYQNALADFQSGLPEYASELKKLADVKKDASSLNRMDIGLDVTKAIRAKANKTDRWLMLVGERFGTIYVQFKKNKVDGTEINADDLRFSLEMIGALATNAPADVPQTFVDKFAKIGKLKDLSNITSEANIEKITDEVLGLLGEIE